MCFPAFFLARLAGFDSPRHHTQASLRVVSSLEHRILRPHATRASCAPPGPTRCGVLAARHPTDTTPADRPGFLWWASRLVDIDPTPHRAALSCPLARARIPHVLATSSVP